MYFVRYLGGSDVFRRSFISLKVIASGGKAPPDPPLSQLYTVILSGPMGQHSNQQSVYRLSSVLEC